MMGILALKTLVASGQSSSATSFGYCQDKAWQADTGGTGDPSLGDNILNPEEFATMVYNMTNGTLDFFTAPGGVPGDVTASYAGPAAASGGQLDLSNETLVVEFCDDLYGALLNFYGTPYNPSTCLAAVELGQGNNPRYVRKRLSSLATSLAFWIFLALFAPVAPL
jgi:hypothetical protein